MSRTWRGRVCFVDSDGNLLATSTYFGFDIPSGPGEQARAEAMLRHAWKEAGWPMQGEPPDNGTAIGIKYEVEVAS